MRDAAAQAPKRAKLCARVIVLAAHSADESNRLYDGVRSPRLCNVRWTTRNPSMASQARQATCRGRRRRPSRNAGSSTRQRTPAGMHSRTISIQLVDSLVFVALRFMPDDDCRPDPSARRAQFVTLLVVTIRVQGPWGTATRSTNRQETLSLSPLSSANPRHPFSAGETSMPAWL